MITRRLINTCCLCELASIHTTGDGYSLEEARNKREEDKLLAAADAKKQGVRAYVQELRK